jgi:hypothetical protein
LCNGAAQVCNAVLTKQTNKKTKQKQIKVISDTFLMYQII